MKIHLILIDPSDEILYKETPAVKIKGWVDYFAKNVNTDTLLEIIKQTQSVKSIAMPSDILEVVIIHDNSNKLMIDILSGAIGKYGIDAVDEIYISSNSGTHFNRYKQIGNVVNGYIRLVKRNRIKLRELVINTAPAWMFSIGFIAIMELMRHYLLHF